MTVVAWRILIHEAGRSALAIGGIFIAILMIFLQLGFYAAVPAAGVLIYDKMRFDILLTSSSYVFQGQPGEFPRRRLQQAEALPDIASAAPVYLDAIQWSVEKDRTRREVFIIGFKLGDPVFDAPDVDRQIDTLRRPDTVLVDTASFPIYGPVGNGTVAEIGSRAVTIGGRCEIGIGLLGLGVILVSDQNFLRLVSNRSLTGVNFGLIRLNNPADANRVANNLRAIMPADTRVFTRAELLNHETSYYLVRTSTGVIFGFGVVVSIIVGLVILYQTLSTLVVRQLPQYATLKAMGYTDRYLGGIVVSIAMLMSALAYIPAIGASIGLYQVIHNATKLPVAMTGLRLLGVLVITILISSGSALYALRVVRRANPVDLF